MAESEEDLWKHWSSFYHLDEIQCSKQCCDMGIGLGFPYPQVEHNSIPITLATIAEDRGSFSTYSKK